MHKSEHKNDPPYAWWISIVFVLLAVSFALDIWGDKKEIREHPPVEEVYYSTHPVREPFASAKTKQGAFVYDCADCHQNLEPPDENRPLVGAHTDIVLHHEQAMSCYTCHSKNNREQLMDIYGKEVSFEQSDQLCRRCHGPRYRDWELGIHGRPMGHWDTTKGERHNLTCVYCHDPHQPKFQPMKPSPPPSRNNFLTNKPVKQGSAHE